MFCLYNCKMKQSHWLLCAAKNCDWSRKITPLSNLTWASLLVEWKFTAKAELNCEIYKENAESQVGFVIRAALRAEKLGRCLEYCRSWKNTLGKLAVVVNLEAIRFEFWMKGALVMVEIYVLCGWWFTNQFEIKSETPFSCNTVGRELYWATLCSLLCLETDWNIRIGKQGYMFILTYFKKQFWCFIPDINQCVNNYFETEKSSGIAAWLDAVIRAKRLTD